MRRCICLFIVFVSLPTYANSIPDISVIESWMSEDDREAFHLYAIEDSTKVYLTNKELAYLVPAAINDAGRNNMFATALVIPGGKEVILLEGEAQDIDKIVDLDNDNVSEIAVKASGSGQGSEIGVRSIIHIDPYGYIDVLHSFSFEYGESSDGNSFSKDVEWEFFDIDRDGNADLVENVITKESVRYGKPTVSIEKHNYLYKNSHFVEENNIKH